VFQLAAMVRVGAKIFDRAGVADMRVSPVAIYGATRVGSDRP
jgi:hypothetical protein